jgi:hypothetical protein
MDKRVEQIIEGFKVLLKGVEGSFIASVVEDKKTTVDVQDFNGTLYPDVRKIATKGAKGFIPNLPKNSFVLVSRISKSDDLFISMMSEIEGIDFDVKNDIVINGGKNNGLVKVKELTEKINAIEKDINSLKQVFSLWVTAPNDGGAALKTAAGTWYGSVLQLTNQLDIENKNIKH